MVVKAKDPLREKVTWRLYSVYKTPQYQEHTLSFDLARRTLSGQLHICPLRSLFCRTLLLYQAFAIALSAGVMINSRQ